MLEKDKYSAKLSEGHSDRARTMFFICKDSCMCTAPPGHGGQDSAYANPTVLYCFGEVSVTIKYPTSTISLLKVLTSAFTETKCSTRV